MMNEWRIIVPVWGPRYVHVFRTVGLPAIAKAIKHFNQPCRVILYADRSDGLQDDIRAMGLHGEVLPVPGPDRAFMSLSNAHRDALRRAIVGQRIVLLTADLILSAGSLGACAKRFSEGKHLICCAGMRVDEDFPPPSTDSSREMLSWGWEHRHPMTTECTWPNGYSYDVARMYFQNGEEVACRLILPHPIALVASRKPINFHPTIDVNVAANFHGGETHLVQDPDELALLELSPRDKDFVLTETMERRLDKRLPSNPSFIKLVHPRSVYFFEKKIIIKGTGGDCGDDVVVRRMLHGQ